MQETKASYFYGLLLLLSLVAAFFSLSISYPDKISARSAAHTFEGVYPDRWIEDGARLEFNNLASRGNVLELGLNSWRGAQPDPAQLLIRVCGNQVANFRVMPDQKIYPISLRGSCEPRLVQIKVVNPWMPTDSDRRLLATQLESISITSSLGMVLPSEFLVGLSALMIFIVSAFFFGVLRGSSLQLLSLLFPVIGFLLLRDSTSADYEKLFWLWFLFAFVCSGLFIGRALSSAEDREVSPAEIARISAYLALAVIAIATALRFYGINFGLPANYHPDEVPKVNAIMRMRERGDFNPRYFLHPSLLLYSTWTMNTILRGLGILGGEWRESAFLAGRCVSALAGICSVGLVFLVGRRIYSPITGLVAALALAVFPLHVTCSRYLKEDSLLLFFILLTLYLVVRAVQSDKPWILFLAALAAGLSASTKYSGLLTAGILLGAPWLKSRALMPDSRFCMWTALSLLVVPIGFLVATPYSVLDHQKFVLDFQYESRHMQKGHTVAVDPWVELWVFHFSKSLVPGIHPVAMAISLIGVGLLLWRRRVEDLMIVGLVLYFYLPAEWVKAKPAPQPERYVLPCAPFLALALAEGLRICIGFERTKIFRFFALALLIFGVGFPALRSTKLAQEVRNDTRDKMGEWMKANLPKGAKVYLDWKPYTPALSPDDFQVTYIPRNSILERLDVQDLKRSGQEYLLMSSLFYDRYFTQANQAPALRQRIREVFIRVPIVHHIEAKEGSYGFHNPGLTLFSLNKSDFARLENSILQKRLGNLQKTSNEEIYVFKVAGAVGK